MTVSVVVENTGVRAGQEVVLLYVQDLFASVAPPVRRLPGFEKVALEPGEHRTVTFTLHPDDLSFINQQSERVVEPGEFEVQVGPDVLDEALWNVLAMQDEDGGVYHKLTHADFSGRVMPHQATAPRYVVQKGTAATLDFAAVTAQASRLVAPFEAELPGLADSLLTAALAAWDWARANPSIAYDQAVLNAFFDPNINTGEYGDSNFADEFDWAAMELYVTTRADSFLTITPPTDPVQMSTPWWGGVRTLGYYTLLHHRGAVVGDVDTAALRAGLLMWADGLVAHRAGSAYGVVMGESPGNFVWGSNSVAANQGIALVRAYRLTGDDAYLLGRNATGFSFVTGHGDRTPMRPYHRPSDADALPEPVPGLLAGGPNPVQQDGCTVPVGRAGALLRGRLVQLRLERGDAAGGAERCGFRRGRLPKRDVRVPRGDGHLQRCRGYDAGALGEGRPRPAFTIEQT